MKSYKLNVNLKQLNLPDVINCSEEVDGPLVASGLFIGRDYFRPELVETDFVPDAPTYPLEAFRELVKRQGFSAWINQRTASALENAKLLSGEISLAQYVQRTRLGESDAAMLAQWAPSEVRVGTPTTLEGEVIDLMDFEEEDLPPDEFVAWPCAQVPFYSIVAAPGGTGKSSWLLGLALYVAAGRPRYGNILIKEPRGVLMINLDDPVEIVRKRTAAARTIHGITKEDTAGRINFWRPKYTMLMVDGDSDSETSFYHELDAKLKALKPGLLILDPLVNFHGLNENDNTRMSALAQKVIGLLKKHHCSCIIAHHPPKGHFEVNDDLIRGASAIATNARSTIFVLPGKAKGTVQVVHEKHSYTQEMEPATFGFESYDVANGDNVGVLVSLSIGDPLAWEGLDEFLELVAAGRGEGLPWAASRNAQADLRLDTAVDKRWGAGTAEQVIPALVAAGMIKIDTVQVPKKPRGMQPMRAWVVCTTVQNPDALVAEPESVE